MVKNPPRPAPDFRCWLLGCKFEDYYQDTCSRCGEGICYVDYVDLGFIDRLVIWLARIWYAVRIRRCQSCGAITGIGVLAPVLCSKECMEDTLPW